MPSYRPAWLGRITRVWKKKTQNKHITAQCKKNKCEKREGTLVIGIYVTGGKIFITLVENR